VSEMWTVKQAAEVMGCHEATIRRMIQRGQLPAARVGSQYRIRPADLEPTVIAQDEPSPSAPREPAGRFARLVRELAGTGGHSDRA
jgi:excisionase family DNA binding protein